MIVVDTSVIVALLEREADCDKLLLALQGDHERWMSTASALEAAIVLGRRRGPGALEDVLDLIDALAIELAAFDRTQLLHAFKGFQTFGKGMNSAAKLNFGDCFVYGLTKSLNANLIFKGSDFSETDVLAG